MSVTDLVKKLDGLKNVAPRVKASTGDRRLTVSRQDEIAKKMAEAQTPGDVGKLAISYGVNEDEILQRAKGAPNFGQFRMVMGNRMRGIARRKKENGGTYAEAAYPPKRQKAGKRTVKSIKKVGGVKKIVKAGSAKEPVRR